jgi:hypothetical protein
MKHMRSQYSLSRYFTPPRVEPLNLDLARLGGGGYAPAQFEGETHDGREVYIRYRGGGFSVTVANGPGVADETCILDVQIGPPLHGGISIGQLCRYFGITINEELPPLPTPAEMIENGCRDLSGATTFYDIWLSSTFDTQKLFLIAALASLPKATLIQPVLDQLKVTGYRVCPSVGDLALDHSYLFLGRSVTAETLASLTEERILLHALEDYTVIPLGTAGFQYQIRKYSNDDRGYVHRATGKVISVAGQVDECLHGSFSLHSQFRTEDPERRKLLQGLDQLLDEFFPAYEVAYFDLLTGDKEFEDGYVIHLDPAVVAWLDTGPDRWLHVLNKSNGQNPRFVGARPIRMVTGPPP